mmetsp:Transcript_3464/g.12316  ORF Transcript_3464/g.12316 Transcript_3464/m.12316 type:complete len:91 (+) Transcript_3464:53-325(+)
MVRHLYTSQFPTFAQLGTVLVACSRVSLERTDESWDSGGRKGTAVRNSAWQSLIRRSKATCLETATAKLKCPVRRPLWQKPEGWATLESN